ncbi:MAG: hypothetical protein ACXWK4_10880, partial [Myxococcaceae bacterium]
TSSLTAADHYVAEYNIRMDRLITPDGARLFPDNLRLISHWGLRDELASHYGDTGGLAKQRTIQRVMERIARQGRLTPDAWMKGAVGAPISSDALLAAARSALADVKR